MTQCFKAAVVERSSDYGAYERLEAKHSQDSEHEPKHKESSERVWDVVVVEKINQRTALTDVACGVKM